MSVITRDVQEALRAAKARVFDETDNVFAKEAALAAALASGEAVAISVARATLASAKAWLATAKGQQETLALRSDDLKGN
jgi:hypothetical protein